MSAGFWPDLDELKQILDITSDDWDGDADYTRLTRLLDAAIAQVKADVGQWDDLIDVPDAKLSQAALRMAELMALRPDAAANVFRATAFGGSATDDPTYLRLIYGHRRRFGIA